jgi:hypothetical protein
MGIIYKITDKTNNNIYIGSSKQTAKLREQNHKRLYKSYLKGGSIKGYTSSFEILKNNDYIFEVLEETDDLKIREQYWIENIDCINKINANVDIKQYQKEWYEKNRERVIEKSKSYVIDNADKTKEYQQKYRDEHKEKTKEYNKQYKLKKKTFKVDV